MRIEAAASACSGVRSCDCYRALQGSAHQTDMTHIRGGTQRQKVERGPCASAAFAPDG